MRSMRELLNELVDKEQSPAIMNNSVADIFNSEVSEMVEVKYKKTSELAADPVYMTDGACGADLTAATERVKQELTGPIVEYDTHIAFEIPKGYVGLVFPRSSITTKTTLTLGNCVGVIDSDYRGTVKFQFRNIFLQGGINKKYKVGDRIGQIVFVPVPQIKLTAAKELSETKRGEGGFGSTK